MIGALVGLTAFALLNVTIDVARHFKGQAYAWPNPAGLALFVAVGALIDLAF